MNKRVAGRIEELLGFLRRGYTLKEAAVRLGISEEEARLIYYTLAAQGLVKIIQPKTRKCSCEGCPFRKYCTLSIKGRVARRKS